MWINNEGMIDYGLGCHFSNPEQSSSIKFFRPSINTVDWKL